VEGLVGENEGITCFEGGKGGVDQSAVLDRGGVIISVDDPSGVDLGWYDVLEQRGGVGRGWGPCGRETNEPANKNCEDL